MQHPDRVLTFSLAVHGGESFPADVDLEPTSDRYVAYYENVQGEQLVFVHERGEQPRLYHGDNGWIPVTAAWPELRSWQSVPFTPWVVSELILDSGEALWLTACLYASAALIDRDTSGEDPVDRLALPKLELAFKAQRQHLDRQYSTSKKALDRWMQGSSSPTHEEQHYAEGAILVALGINTRQRKPGQGVTRAVRERIEREVADAIREVQD